MRKLFLVTFLVQAFTFAASAYDVKVDGIYYDLDAETRQATVTYKFYLSSNYDGDIVIPSYIVIDDITYSVTSIGEDSFAFSYNLTSVYIPNTVSLIDSCAFFSCESLTSVNIPNSVLRIGYSAFYDCYNLQSLVLPPSITEIGSEAFESCKKLESINIPEGVSVIEKGTFHGCENLNSIELPIGVKSIGEEAFSDCEKMTSVSLPNGLEKIEEGAFSCCYSLSSLFIPSSVESIGDGAFGGCGGLETIVVEEGNRVYDSRDNCNSLIKTATDELIRGSKNSFIPDGIRTILSGAFGSSLLTNIIVPNSVTSIGEGAFAYCEALVSVSLPASITSIDICTFMGCSSLTSISIPDNVIRIGQQAFEYCEALVSVSLPASITSIDFATFYGCSSLTHISIPENVIRIGGHAFYDCSSLISVEIPEGVTSIGAFAFRDCSSLTSIVIPESVTVIEEAAFSYCSNLKSIVVPYCSVEDPFFECNAIESIHWNATVFPKNMDGKWQEVILGDSVKYIDDSSFSGQTQLTSISIPENVVRIGESAFYGCIGLDSLFIPKNVEEIGTGAFTVCSGLESIIVDPQNTIYDSRGNCNAIILTKDDELLYGCKNTSIPKDVKKIGYAAFAMCEMDSVLIIPNEVTKIDMFAFGYCSNLETVVIPQSVQSLGYYAFYGCEDLTKVIVGMSTPLTFEMGDWGSSPSHRTFGSVTSDGDSEEVQNAVFSNCANATLYVPAGSKAAYEAAEGWKDFKEIVEFASWDEIMKTLKVEGPSLTDDKANVIYDLNGRQLSASENLSKGIYIMNGRKIVVK